MSFGVVSVTAETDCSLTVPLSVTAVNGKTTFGQSLRVNTLPDAQPKSTKGIRKEAMYRICCGFSIMSRV